MVQILLKVKIDFVELKEILLTNFIDLKQVAFGRHKILSLDPTVHEEYVVQAEWVALH